MAMTMRTRKRNQQGDVVIGDDDGHFHMELYIYIGEFNYNF